MFCRRLPSAEDPGFWSRLIAAVKPYGGRNSGTLIAAISRDFGRNVREAVVPVQNAGVDLAPAFRDVIPGEYPIRLTSLSDGPPVQRRVEWKRETPLVIGGALKPGLYNLSLLDAAGNPVSEAWIYLCEPARLDSASVDFQKALDLAAQSSADFDDAALRPMLRAFLQSIAEAAR
jgi:hypothetical protein